MNKKDIANIRKQFKLNNNLMSIREIFNVYVKKNQVRFTIMSVNHFKC